MNHPAQAALQKIFVEERKQEQENLAAASLKDDPKFLKLESGTYDQYSVVALWCVACCFVGINPSHKRANKTWLEKNRQHIDGNAGAAVKSLFALYELARHECVGNEGKVRFPAFESWALKEGWIPTAMFTEALGTKTAPHGKTSMATGDEAQPTSAPSAQQEPQGMAVEAAVLSDVVVPAKAGPLPEKQGLPTNAIAHAFDGVNEWSAERWRKNLSACQWLRPARVALGRPGGASAVWDPLMLAQLMHGRVKGDREKEKVMKALNSRFTRDTALVPWRGGFNEYFATYCTA